MPGFVGFILRCALAPAGASRSDRARNRRHRRFRKMVAFEPLEDRRMLSIDSTLFVDVDAGGVATGESWEQAIPSLQVALERAEVVNTANDPGNDVSAIWIADGTYRPSERLEPDDARSAVFGLFSDISLIGGFAGRESSLDERMLVDGVFEHETILSGDLGRSGDMSDNAYTVVHSGNQATTTLDGVLITGGNANGSRSSETDYERHYGGGLFVGTGTVTVANSRILGSAGYYGAGIANNNGMLTVINTRFLDNSADRDGGALHNEYGTVEVVNAVFQGNTAGDDGGAIFNYEGILAVTASTITENTAVDRGGGIDNHNGDLTVVSSAISRNSASRVGGGLSNSGIAALTNATLVGNQASNGGGVYNYRGTLTAVNSIISLNSTDDIWGPFSASHSLVSIDPGFVQAPSTGPDGQWGTEDDDAGDLNLTDRSPAINAGSNGQAVDAAGSPLTTDLAHRPRLVDGLVDIGAFEFQSLLPDERETPSLRVTTSDDRLDLHDGNITLREAVYYAQRGIGDGTVTFDPSLDGATIVLAGSELSLFHSITIDASSLSSLTIDAQGQSRVFRIADVATLRGLTITGGAASDGGGIYNSGTLTVINSIVSGNTAHAGGGGIHNSLHGTLSVINTVISENSARSGAGMYSRGWATVTNTTIVNNTADYAGGGLAISNGGCILNNSLVANNEAPNGSDIDKSSYGNLTGAHNLVGNGSDQAAIVDGVDGNQVGTSMAPIDPRLGDQSQRNGGQWGYPLRHDSPAINAGNNDLLPIDTFDLDGDGNTSEPLSTDVTGISRVANGTVDIGAFEFFSPWHNHASPHDVDNNGIVAPLDVLTLINFINGSSGQSELPIPTDSIPNYVDVSHDGKCTPLDVLLVIDEINRRIRLGEGEFDRAPNSIPYEPTFAIVDPVTPRWAEANSAKSTQPSTVASTVIPIASATGSASEVDEIFREDTSAWEELDDWLEEIIVADGN